MSMDALEFSGKNPLVTVGEPGLGCVNPVLFRAGMRTSRRALAPQLIRLAKGLVPTLDGLPDSPSSMALSSAAEVVDDIEDTEPRLNPDMFV
jgi:hypothetical protein